MVYGTQGETWRYTDLTARQLLGLHLSCSHVTDTPSCYMFRLRMNSEIIHISSKVLALTGLSINRKKNSLSSHAKVQNTVAFTPVTIVYFSLATTRFQLVFTTWIFNFDNLSRSFVAQMKCKTPFKEITRNTNRWQPVTPSYLCFKRDNVYKPTIRWRCTSTHS